MPRESANLEETTTEEVPSRLANLFLFNSTWGPREDNEHLKIAYFWSRDSLDVGGQLRRIGLVEALVNFAEIFSKKPAETLHTLKERMAFIQVEPNYWLCLTLSLPYVKKIKTTAGSSTQNEVTEFQPDNVDDNVLLEILRRTYHTFRLFHGRLANILERSGDQRELITKCMDDFFSSYLPNMEVDPADIGTGWGGIQYMALSAHEFLRVQSLITITESKYPNIKQTLFLQAGQLVWSGINLEETRCLVHHIITSILPLLQNSSNTHRTTPKGKFLVGWSDDEPLPQIYADDVPYYLAVYHSIDTTYCILMEEMPDEHFFMEFSDQVGGELAGLSADLASSHIMESSASVTNLQESARFIYYNAANMAIKSTVETSKDSLLRVAADLVEDLKKHDRWFGSGVNGEPDEYQSEAMEITVKLATDNWIVIERAGARTIVVVLSDKHYSLVEITEEIANLKKASFTSICMQ